MYSQSQWETRCAHGGVIFIFAYKANHIIPYNSETCSNIFSYNEIICFVR